MILELTVLTLHSRTLDVMEYDPLFCILGLVLISNPCKSEVHPMITPFCVLLLTYCTIALVLSVSQNHAWFRQWKRQWTRNQKICSILGINSMPWPKLQQLKSREIKWALVRWRQCVQSLCAENKTRKIYGHCQETPTTKVCKLLILVIRFLEALRLLEGWIQD